MHVVQIVDSQRGRLLLDKVEKIGAPRVLVARGTSSLLPGRKAFFRREMILHAQTDLAKVIGALGAPSRFADGLNRRQEESNENSDDRDDHEQFDESKGTPRRSSA